MDFLNETRQGSVSRERFWGPICRSAMNAGPETAPLSGLAGVLNRIFFGKFSEGSAFLVPAYPLSDILFKECQYWLEKNHGGRIHLQEGVQKFDYSHGTFKLKTKSNKVFTGDALVFAVPPSSLASLWPKGTWPLAGQWPRIGKSPIVSVHLILSKRVMEEHLLGLSGATFEWVFNRNANWGWKGNGQYLSFVASAAENLAQQTKKELETLALKELRDRCSDAKEARVLHSKVTREMAATFAWTLENDSLRPSCKTPIPNVFLAGDWTATGLPPTIEGACLSGHQAADKAQTYLREK